MFNGFKSELDPIRSLLQIENLYPADINDHYLAARAKLLAVYTTIFSKENSFKLIRCLHENYIYRFLRLKNNYSFFEEIINKIDNLEVINSILSSSVAIALADEEIKIVKNRLYYLQESSFFLKNLLKNLRKLESIGFANDLNNYEECCLELNYLHYILARGAVDIQAIEWFLDSRIFYLIVNNTEKYGTGDLVGILLVMAQHVFLKQKTIDSLYKFSIYKRMEEKNPIFLKCLNILFKVCELEAYKHTVEFNLSSYALSDKKGDVNTYTQRFFKRCAEEESNVKSSKALKLA